MTDIEQLKSDVEKLKQTAHQHDVCGNAFPVGFTEVTAEPHKEDGPAHVAIENIIKRALTLDTRVPELHAAIDILREIRGNLHKYFPPEVFGPSLLDTLDMVAKIKAAKKEAEEAKRLLADEVRKRHEDHIEYKKETEALKAELDKQDAEWREAEFEWIKALHEEVTAKLNAEDRANAAEVQVAGLQVEYQGLVQDEVDLCDRLNKVCDEFNLDVPDCYSDAFRKALLEARTSSLLLMNRNRQIDVLNEMINNARIDNDQLRTELRHAEKSLADLQRDYRCVVNQRNDIMQISDDDCVKLIKERDEQKRLADKMRPELASLRVASRDYERVAKRMHEYSQALIRIKNHTSVCSDYERAQACQRIAGDALYAN